MPFHDDYLITKRFKQIVKIYMERSWYKSQHFFQCWKKVWKMNKHLSATQQSMSWKVINTILLRTHIKQGRVVRHNTVVVQMGIVLVKETCHGCWVIDASWGWDLSGVRGCHSACNCTWVSNWRGNRLTRVKSNTTPTWCNSMGVWRQVRMVVGVLLGVRGTHRCLMHLWGLGGTPGWQTGITVRWWSSSASSCSLTCLLSCTGLLTVVGSHVGFQVMYLWRIMFIVNH